MFIPICDICGRDIEIPFKTLTITDIYQSSTGTPKDRHLCETCSGKIEKVIKMMTMVSDDLNTKFLNSIKGFELDYDEEKKDKE